MPTTLVRVQVSDTKHQYQPAVYAIEVETEGATERERDARALALASEEAITRFIADVGHPARPQGESPGKYRGRFTCRRAGG